MGWHQGAVPTLQNHGRSADAPASVALDDLESLTELCAGRVITVKIMDEAIRRMRAENAVLEETLARLRK